MDERGLTAAIVVGLLMIAIAATFYIPPIVDDVSGDRELAINQSEGEEIVVYHEINATISDINQGQNNITVVLEDTSTRNDTEARLEEAVAQDLSLEGETITTNATIIGGSTAEMRYTYPVDYNWPDGMKTVADNLGLIVMALISFLLLGWIWTY